MALGRSVSGKDNAMRGGPQSSHFLQAGFINATSNLGSREALGNTKKTAFHPAALNANPQGMVVAG